MSKIGVFRTYELFNAMKLHWNTSYDFVKYNGKVKNLSRVTLEKAHDKHFYSHLNKKYKTSEDLIIFLIPCFLDDPKRPLDEYFDEEVQKKADDWYWKIKRMKNSFFDDSVNIFSFMKLNKITMEFFFTSSLIYSCLVTEQINIETFIILNRIINFIDKYDCRDIIYKNTLEMKVKKYSSFISVNLEEYKKIFEKSILTVKEDVNVKSTLLL